MSPYDGICVIYENESVACPGIGRCRDEVRPASSQAAS